jgi:hypothetical protein
LQGNTSSAIVNVNVDALRVDVKVSIISADSSDVDIHVSIVWASALVAIECPCYNVRESLLGNTSSAIVKVNVDSLPVNVNVSILSGNASDVDIHMSIVWASALVATECPCYNLRESLLGNTSSAIVKVNVDSLPVNVNVSILSANGSDVDIHMSIVWASAWVAIECPCYNVRESLLGNTSSAIVKVNVDVLPVNVNVSILSANASDVEIHVSIVWASASVSIECSSNTLEY